MPAPRPLVTAMVASAGALALSCLSAFALTTVDTETSTRSAGAHRALPPIALSAPASLEAAIGTEPAPAEQPPARDQPAPPSSRSGREIPPAIERIPQPAPAPAPAEPAPAPSASPAPSPDPTPSPTDEPAPSPSPTTTPSPAPPAETPEQPTSSNGEGSAVTAPGMGVIAPDESSPSLHDD